MAWLDETWLRNAFEAVREMFEVDERTKVAMIDFLYDEGFWDREQLSWDAAVARFNGNINPNKAQFFKISELWALAVRFDRPQVLEAWAASMGRELRIIPTEERRLMLLERIAVACERYGLDVDGALASLARMDAKPEPKRTVPLAGPRPLFSRENLP